MARGKWTPNIAFGKLERVTLWIGALCGIAVSLFTIYSELSKPGAPLLEINFVGTKGSWLGVIANPTSSHSWTTKTPFPIGLRVINKGETTARRVILRVFTPQGIRIRDGQMPFKEMLIQSRDKIEQLTILDLGDVNPKQTVYLDFELKMSIETPWFVVPGVIHDPEGNIAFTLAEPFTPGAGWAHTFVVKAAVCAEDLKEEMAELNIAIGTSDALRKIGAPVFEVAEWGGLEKYQESSEVNRTGQR